MTLRNLTRVVCYGVVLPLVVTELLDLAAHANDTRVSVPLLIVGEVVLLVSSLVTLVAGWRLRARTQGRDRTPLMILMIIGGAPICLFILFVFVALVWGIS
jgi:hypothetical protein